MVICTFMMGFIRLVIQAVGFVSAKCGPVVYFHQIVCCGNLDIAEVAKVEALAIGA